MKAAATASKSLDVQLDSPCAIRHRKSGFMSRLKNLGGGPQRGLNHPYFRFSNVNLAKSSAATKIGGNKIRRKFSKLFPKRSPPKQTRKPTKSSNSCSEAEMPAEELEKVSEWLETMPKQLSLNKVAENIIIIPDENEALKDDPADTAPYQYEIEPSKLTSGDRSSIDDDLGSNGDSLENRSSASAQTSAVMEVYITDDKVDTQSESEELSPSSSLNAAGTKTEQKWIQSLLICWKRGERSYSAECGPMGLETVLHEGGGAAQIPQEKPKPEHNVLDEIEHLTSLLNQASGRKSRMRSIFSLKGQLRNSTRTSFATRVSALFSELFRKCYGNRTDATMNQVAPADAPLHQLPMSEDINNNSDTGRQINLR